MLRAKTVFILGAGASKEVGLPVGDQLLFQICKLIDIRYGPLDQMVSGDNLVSEALKLHLNDGRPNDLYFEHLHCARQIMESAQQAISIDNIVDALESSKVEFVAKLGIVKAIHNAESESHFFRPKRIGYVEYNLSKFSGTWYSFLTKILCENCRISDITKVFENLSFVSFNYDRCIEHYLPYSIANYYGVKLEDIQELFQLVKVHRPYGIAGELPWQRGLVSKAPFGGGNVSDLLHAALEIRTFTQGVEHPEDLLELRNDLMGAERIVFLGSAFHRQNLELLKIAGNPDVEVLATASGVSDSDVRVVKNELADIFGISPDMTSAKITLAKMHCEPFFREHWRTLTAAPNSTYQFCL